MGQAMSIADRKAQLRLRYMRLQAQLAAAKLRLAGKLSEQEKSQVEEDEEQQE